MTRIYDNQTPPIKWCLQRIFKKTELIFISSRHSEAVFYHEPALYYDFGKEFSTDTFEECTPIPLNLIKILKFAARERKKKDIQKYLLKPLSKELYERLRKSYPHRHKDNWEQGVNYLEILCDPKDSLFHEKELEKYPFPKDYTKWKEKIILYTKAKRYEEAIFLLNHLFMGDVDDTEEKMREDLENRYCSEFNLDPNSAAYNILVVDDFFFLHIYQFSLVERCDAKYNKDTGKILPKIHFHFECNPDSVVTLLEEEKYDKVKKYDLILLDIDFGQQNKKATDVAKEAHKKGIPILMFSKFEMAEKYDIFQEELYPLVLPRIKKDLEYETMYNKLKSRLEEVDNIKKNVLNEALLKIAQNIQRTFLSEEEYKEVNNIEFYGKNEICINVSGDYYFFDKLDDSTNNIAIVIADVEGKGISASLITSALHIILLMLIPKVIYPKVSSPELIVSEINKIISKIFCQIGNLAIFFGILNPYNLDFEYVNAGLSSPLVLFQSGELKELKRDMGFTLGYFPESDYQKDKITLEKGSIICIYTDGITEAKSPTGEEFGINRLKNLVKPKRESNASEIGKGIFEELKTFSETREKEDDQTLVIIRVKPD